MAPFPVSRTGFPQQPLLCGILHPLELSGGFYGPPGSEQGGAEVPTGEAPGGYASKLSTRQADRVLRRFYGVFTDFDARLVGGWRIFRNCSPAIFVAMLERLVGGPIAKKGVGEYAVPVVHALRRRGSSYGTP
jgi:hypothetical protein